MDEKQIQARITELEDQKKQVDEEVDQLLILKEKASSQNDLAYISKLVTQLTDLNFKQVEIEEKIMDLEEQLYEVQTKNLENRKTLRTLAKSVSDPSYNSTTQAQQETTPSARTRITQSQSFAGSSRKVTQILGENPSDSKAVGKLSKFFGESANDIQTMTKNSLRSKSMSGMPVQDLQTPSTSTPSSTPNNNNANNDTKPTSLSQYPTTKTPTHPPTQPATSGTLRKEGVVEEIPQSSTQYGVIPSALQHHTNPFETQSTPSTNPKSNYVTIPKFLENMEVSQEMQQQAPKPEPQPESTEPNIFQELLRKYPVFSGSSSTLRRSETANATPQQPQIASVQEDASVDSPRTQVRRMVQNHSSWEIEFTELEFEEVAPSFVLDEDYNIVVKKAMWREQEVFFKEWKADNVNGKKWEHYKEEISLLVTLKIHQNVLKIYGICVDPSHPIGLVTEWMELGPLKFLLQTKPDEIGKVQLIHIIRDISRGVKHLHMEGVVHGRLCARSVLVNETKTGWECKISSFGMTKPIQGQNQIKEANRNMLRWMAPETLSQGVFNQKSDSWMLGCTISEILTGGKDPYFDISDPIAAAAAVVHEDRKPSIPDDCPALLASLHVLLVQSRPEKRPDFVQILKTLDAVEEDIKSNPFY